MSGKPLSRAEFLKRRLTGIGGSDIAAIAGLSPWKSPLEVYWEKTGATVVEEDLPHPMGQLAALYWGSVHESAIGRAYVETTGRKIMRYNRLLRHPGKPYFIGDLDYLGYCHDGRPPFLPKSGEIRTEKGVECKTSRFAAANDEWGESGTDEVPAAYICQVQWYMGLIPPIGSFDLPVLFGGSDFRIYTVFRDNGIIAALQEIGEEFWHKYVLPRIPPPPRSFDEVQRLWPQSREKSLTADGELEKKAARLAALNGETAALTKEAEALKKEIGSAMRDHDTLIRPDGSKLLTFKTNKNGVRSMRPAASMKTQSQTTEE